MNSDDFGEDIALKPYPKYEYQEVLKGPKRVERNAFLEAINDLSHHSYSEKSREKRGHWLFYP